MICTHTQKSKKKMRKHKKKQFFWCNYVCGLKYLNYYFFIRLIFMKKPIIKKQVTIEFNIPILLALFLPTS